MSYIYKNLNIEKLSVIGAGQIGPDICLHFAKVFWKNDVQLVIIDIAEEALANAQKKIEKKIAKGEETGAFKPEMAAKMKQSIAYTSDYKQITGSAIVLEAATEDEKIKELIFKQVEELTDESCLFFSNSSHMEPEVIFKNIANKTRCLVTHYFFPAERNPIVEVVPGKETNPMITNLLLGFYENIGKIPIQVKSSYGYAIDPIFEGLCELAILCLEKGYGTVKEIDKMAQKTLGQGVGPFTALNLTGGNPITNHGLEEMRKTHNPWFRSPKALQDATASGEVWATAKRGEEVTISEDKAEILRKQFLGGYFALASYIVDRGISHVNDLDMATSIALVIKPPFSLMNKLGIDASVKLVREWCEEYSEFPFPVILDKVKQQGGWKISNVLTAIQNDVCVITIRRPQVLNALNLNVLEDIKSAVENAEADNSIKAIVITGFGTKAFVSGADINMISGLKTAEDGYNNSHTFQSYLNKIAACSKPLVCALNGFAFGGGNELALACKSRVAKKGLKVLACQPEVNLGFIPGAGGTQRLPRLVGIVKAAEILRTGRPVSGSEAMEIGLIDKEIEGDLIDGAVTYALQIANREIQPKKLNENPLDTNGGLPAIDIRHLSRKIDAILVHTILEGAKLPLDQALEIESRMFGACLETEDMKIGLDNFNTNGPKSKASFIHK